MVFHLFDKYEDLKIPKDNQAKMQGYRMAICGNQRQLVTSKIEQVTCKHCLKIINDSYEDDNKAYEETLESLKRDMY